MIKGLSHITFIVSDLEKTANMLKSVLDAEEVYSSGDDVFSIAREKFFLIGGVWIAIMEGDPLREQSYNHVAFRVDEKDMEKYIDRLHESGLEIKDGRRRIDGEGRSIYFYDYDNHLFELHTGTLRQRLTRYAEAKT